MSRLLWSLAASCLLLFRVAVAQDPPAPVPAEEAPARMSVPDGFEVTLFAGEPDVVQPMAFTFDDRGRLWVVECLSYPQWETEGKPGKDRIVVFADDNGDGRFDSKTVFFDKGTNLTGIELGFGGVWLTAVPNLIFIPDGNGDDVPDGPPEVVLDGFDLKAKHNVVNGLTWGPDGWLYGLNGILSNSKVGAPGASEEARTPLNCGVWRVHPVTKKFEAVAHGTTNPWGLDFDQHGEMFITNCVIKHLFHVIPGAHYTRMFGQDINPHSYGLIESCADHIHWGGGRWQDSRGGKGEHDKPGGGHAHVGAMVYLGDNWPDAYRHQLYTCNLHGNRINRDILEVERSGCVARHGEDFLFANDPWFRGLELKYGPDGGVFLTDWSDTDECHDYEDIHRENGRIFKITYGKPKPVKIDVARMSDAELVALHNHKNEWQVRHARRVLHERAVRNGLSEETVKLLKDGLSQSLTGHAVQTLRFAWTLHAAGKLDDGLRLALMNSGEPYVRGWAVRLSAEEGKPGKILLSGMNELARKDPSPIVRLQLASVLQRLPLEQRWSIAEELIAHADDADDHFLPLMYWYAIEPLVAQDRTRALQLVVKSKIPIVRQYIARRAATLK